MSSSTQPQCCSVPQYTVMVTSATSTDMSAVNVSYCTSNSCSYVQSISGANVSSYNVSVACRNRLNQTGLPYVVMQSELHIYSLCHHGYLLLRCPDPCTLGWSVQCEREYCCHHVHIPGWLLPLLCGVLQY